MENELKEKTALDKRVLLRFRVTHKESGLHLFFTVICGGMRVNNS